MSTKRIVKFEIYRYDPDKDERPYICLLYTSDAADE